MNLRWLGKWISEHICDHIYVEESEELIQGGMDKRITAACLKCGREKTVMLDKRSTLYKPSLLIKLIRWIAMGKKYRGRNGNKRCQ